MSTMANPEAKPEDEEGDEGQSFISHLLELRDRLLRMVLAVIIVFLSLVYWANDLYHWLSKPLLKMLPEGSKMIATEVASPFLTPFKLTLMVSIFISIPYLLYQFWGFIAPGLYRHERRMAVPILVSSVALFYSGMAFAYYAVFPLIFKFFASTTPVGVAFSPDISKYLDFVLTIFFAFGAAFEVPIATIVLVWMGVTTPAQLRKMRPYIIVGAFAVGAVLTPPDAVSQSMLALPMWALFELGVVFSRFYQPRERRDDDEDEDASSPASESTSTAVATPPAAGATATEPDSDYKPMSDEEMEQELDRLSKLDDASPDNEPEPPKDVPKGGDDPAGKDPKDK